MKRGAPRAQVIVMVKVPRPGRVKTRLAAGIGPVAATWWMRHATARLIRRLSDPRWDLVLSVSPDAEGLSTRLWPRGPERRAQGDSDLGRRMIRALTDAPPGPVVVIGADVPGIERRDLAAAFRALKAADAVFGPSEDGGFWLIGVNRRRASRRGQLDGARWSTRHALSDASTRLDRARIARLRTLSDVDEVADLRRQAVRRKAR